MKSKLYMSRFPLSDIKFHDVPVVGQFYTKQEVDKLLSGLELARDLLS